MRQNLSIPKSKGYLSNHSSAADLHKLVLKRQDSIHSERRRDIKHTRKASYFTKAQKKQEGLLSEDDDSLGSMCIPAPPENFLDPIDQQSIMSDECMFLHDDFVLDTTQDLPIRQPQSAYVIFGKMVSDR